MDLSILSKDVEYLKKLKIITPNYKDPYRVCQNDDCVCSEDKELFESYTKICTHCTSKLVRIGSEAIINRNIFGIKKMINGIHQFLNKLNVLFLCLLAELSSPTSHIPFRFSV